MDIHELLAQMQTMFPNMTIGNDDDGRLVIYTNASIVVNPHGLEDLLERSDWG
jgi:hypothetical protein